MCQKITIYGHVKMKSKVICLFICIVVSFAIVTKVVWAKPKFFSIRQIHNSHEKYQNWSLKIKGRIYHSNYYINDKLKKDHVPYKVVDKTGTAYLYMIRSSSLALNNAIRRNGNGAKGLFSIRLRSQYCKKKEGAVLDN